MIIDGTVAIVTGASGGIGSALAQQLLDLRDASAPSPVTGERSWRG